MPSMKYNFKEFEKRCKRIAEEIKKHPIKDIYGIPRGGLIVAVRLSHLTGLPLAHDTNPDTTAVVDDCIDGGKTREKYKDFKYFYVLIDKQKEGIKEWIEFWWENK